jgi:hypothetical protein
VVEQAMTNTPLPGFDLLVVGDPVEQSAILKFAQASGLSQAAVAELFSAGANDAANASAPEGALAQAVANWIAANQGAEIPKGLSLQGLWLTTLMQPSLHCLRALQKMTRRVYLSLRSPLLRRYSLL